MNHELQEQQERQEDQYFEDLKQRANQLQGQEARLANALLELCEYGYVHAHHDSVQQLKQVLKQAAGQQPEKLLEPLENVVRVLAGEEVATRLEKIRKQSPEYPYANGYMRRPFRTSDPSAHLVRMLSKLMGLLWIEASKFSLTDYLTQREYSSTRTRSFYRSSQVLPDLIAQHLDDRDEAVESALRDIIFGENQTALLSREMISGMLMSHRPDVYEWVGNLLVAARLQEGLRQSIVESVDFGTTEAFMYMLKLILDQGFVRYSSIVRAAAVWTGLPLEVTDERIVTQLLEKMYSALSDAELRMKWTQSSNAQEVFIGLFAQALIEESEIPFIVKGIMEHGAHYNKVAAQYMISMSQYEELKYMSALDILSSGERDPELLYWMMNNYTYDYQLEWKSEEESDEQQNQFDKDTFRLKVLPAPGLDDKETRRQQFEALSALLSDKLTKVIKGNSGALDFLSYTYDPAGILRKMMYLTAYDMDTQWVSRLIDLAPMMNADRRHDLLRFFLKDPEDSKQREFVFAMFADKSLSNRESALKRARKFDLTDHELERVENILKLKTGALRQNAVALLLVQNRAALESSLNRLLSAKTELQRIAGLELLTELSADDLRSDDYEALRPLSEKIASPTPKEQQLLSKLEVSKSNDRYTASNGFGLYDPNQTEAWLKEPQGKPADFARFFAWDDAKMTDFIKGLDQLVHSLRDTEYEVQYYNNSKEKLLLGTQFRPLSYSLSQELSILQPEYARYSSMDNYPLADEWKAYLANSGFGAKELLGLHMIVETKELSGMLDDFYGEFSDYYDYDKMRKTRLLDGWREQYVSGLYPIERLKKLWKVLDKCKYTSTVGTLLNLFYEDSEPEYLFDTAAASLEKLFIEFPSDVPQQEQAVWLTLASDWMWVLRRNVYNDASFKTFVSCAFRYDDRRRELGGTHIGSTLDIRMFFKAHSLGLLGDNEIYKQILGESSNYILRNLTTHAPEELQGSERLQQIMKSIVDRLLEIELARGDLATEVTPLTMSLQRIEGLDALIRILVSLGGETFVRGYIYSYGHNQTKKESLSHLLKVCYPAEGDDAAKLAENLEGTGISEKRLLEAAMYAPQWIEIVSAHLGWEGLRSAAWYFHAHINESFSAEKETIVAHYSPITPQEFNDGAFDVQWFEEAYATIGAERFKLLYDCAKYISGGANHRRSQLFADAVLGKLNLADTQKQVETKRGKDQLLAYSLIPLSKKKESDLRERYDFIQKFLLESRQFGAQRRASESAASQIALSNLARSAGYADSTRLQWDMEAGKVDELQAYMEPHAVDDVEVQLVVNELGLPTIVATKSGKSLKSVPSRLNKNEYIVRIKEVKTELTEQHRRFVRELERSMENGATFQLDELTKLYRNPVVAPLLSKLVFRLQQESEDTPVVGYFQADKQELEDIQTKQGRSLDAKSKLTIAHPVDLYGSGQWQEFQRDMIERNLQAEASEGNPIAKQPFKQIFRELYTPNADELAAVTSSSRYAGHQVQPSKTVALLRGRGWTVSYEEGLQKVDYKHNVIATLYAMADWFSPADTEAPTLELIHFSDRRTHQSLALKDVPPVLFSEIMRDVDLVVSVAHVGGVDPEASLTTVELRTAILSESLSLLRIDNVRLEGSYAHIQGSLGEYAVHLGSGVAYKQATGALNIIPVHAGQRGRFFLPFLDEDPRTAEVLSKIVMLAEDTKIKDPQILEQIKH
ncbi:DUF4132 domain-containing protein [Saccharibacillus sp. JS10]|uniref:DUF4132 domain-containing protein n=1 Tax=Saccharibacillus sp. JS10 TaxID=2950552 RepID=UPI0021091754|nr:DUF4132 domain-containing protein [Saccharibacillus sp. JS10]MCQ4086451.1 DUF4132 domain-containing protein [Saccharibacillus sp. JS10]